MNLYDRADLGLHACPFNGRHTQEEIWNELEGKSIVSFIGTRMINLSKASHVTCVTFLKCGFFLHVVITRLFVTPCLLEKFLWTSMNREDICR